MQFMANEHPLQTSKNAFYLIVKALFVFKYLNLCSDFFGYVEKRLDEKAKVSSNIYDVTARPTITINILPNISRRKGIHTMKFGQLVEYNIRKFLLKNHTYNVVQKLVPDHFSKISKLNISLNLQSEVLYRLFIVCSSGRLLKYN